MKELTNLVATGLLVFTMSNVQAEVGANKDTACSVQSKANKGLREALSSKSNQGSSNTVATEAGSI